MSPIAIILARSRMVAATLNAPLNNSCGQIKLERTGSNSTESLNALSDRKPKTTSLLLPTPI